MKTFVMVMICSLIVLWNVSAQAEELPLATGEWPPYTSEHLEGYGFFTELMTAIVHEMGMTPKYFFCPWKRCERTTLVGEVFAAFPYAVTKTRKKDFDFSDLIMKKRTLLFYNRKHLTRKPEVNALKDLKPYRIGGVLGYDYVQAFSQAGLKVDYVATDKQNVLKLYKKRIDIAVWDAILGWHLIQQLYPDEKEVFGTLETSMEAMADSLQEGDSYLMISRSYPNAKQLRDRFNQALQRIHDKGIYQSIFEKYGIRGPSR